MLNKLKFNNLVISNKKGIQKSRIQTINKLVHKVRKLKTLLEKQPHDAKFKERIRKSTATMELLKKLKIVDIMKKVLLMGKPPAAIITNGLSTPEEVGVALLAMNKIMHGLIKRFKTELQLNEAEPYKWQEVLKEMSKRKQKIAKTEEKRRKRLEMKQLKAIGRKRQEWLEQNNQESLDEKDTLDADLNVSTVGKWKIETLPTNMDNDEQNTKKIQKVEKKTLKDKPIYNKSEIPKKKRKLTETNVVDTSEGEKENGTAQLSSKKEKSELTEFDQISNSHNTDEEIEEALVVDPFFITDTGENYLSTAVIKRDQNAEDRNSEDIRDLHMIKLNNTSKKPNEIRDRRQQYKDKNQQVFWEKHDQNKNKYNKPNDRNDKFSSNKWANQTDKDHNFQKRDKDFIKQNSNNTTNEHNLHPSWVAKQKQKPFITGIQGKRITFEDDDSNTQIEQQSTNKSYKTETSKSYNSGNGGLHPSWAAKQKLKPTISAFQGKRIVFDNDDE